MAHVRPQIHTLSLSLSLSLSIGASKMGGRTFSSGVDQQHVLELHIGVDDVAIAMQVVEAKQELLRDALDRLQPRRSS